MYQVWLELQLTRNQIPILPIRSNMFYNGQSADVICYNNGDPFGDPLLNAHSLTSFSKSKGSPVVKIFTGFILNHLAQSLTCSQMPGSYLWSSPLTLSQTIVLHVMCRLSMVSCCWIFVSLESQEGTGQPSWDWQWSMGSKWYGALVCLEYVTCIDQTWATRSSDSYGQTEVTYMYKVHPYHTRAQEF